MNWDSADFGLDKALAITLMIFLGEWDCDWVDVRFHLSDNNEIDLVDGRILVVLAIPENDL